MIERLNGLGHHAVIGGNDENDNVCGARTASTHGGKRLVARSIDKGDLATLFDDLVGTDVLGDAAGFASDDVGLAKAVEQQGLAVVHVAHDGDDRRTGDFEVGIVGLVVEHLQQPSFLLLARIDEQQLAAHLKGEELHGVVGQALAGGDHFALEHEEANDVGGGAVELGTQLLGRRTALDDDLA